MPRSCSVCAHEARTDIDRELVGNAALPTIATKYDVSAAALGRHRANHVPLTLVEAEAAKEVAAADDLLAQVRSLQAKAVGILQRAEGRGQLGYALGAIREARGCIELQAKLLGQIDERPQINV